MGGPFSRYSTQMRLKHYSLRTEKTYKSRIIRYIRFHGMKHPAETGEPEVEEFLTNLAAKACLVQYYVTHLSTSLNIWPNVAGQARGQASPVPAGSDPVIASSFVLMSSHFRSKGDVCRFAHRAAATPAA
jgi:hypothetical protein